MGKEMLLKARHTFTNLASKLHVEPWLGVGREQGRLVFDQKGRRGLHLVRLLPKISRTWLAGFRGQDPECVTGACSIRPEQSQLGSKPWSTWPNSLVNLAQLPGQLGPTPWSTWPNSLVNQICNGPSGPDTVDDLCEPVKL
ncbi:hypothetical protein Bbelb_262280 [Branchiostoma belcheri]|nr:hypothetical protein Bbelb_262280 [Branchiostoma belcheri]